MIIILLDVDGVLNSSRAGWSRAPSKGVAFAQGNLWTMKWEPEVMEHLKKLNRNPAVRILWCTTWCGDTEQLENLFKLPALLSAGSSAMSVIDKQCAALDVIEDSHHKLIWIDDEAIPLSGEVYDKLTDDPDRVLLIRPSSSRGLRPEHFDKIHAFVLES